MAVLDRHESVLNTNAPVWFACLLSGLLALPGCGSDGKPGVRADRDDAGQDTNIDPTQDPEFDAGEITEPDGSVVRDDAGESDPKDAGGSDGVDIDDAGDESSTLDAGVDASEPIPGDDASEPDAGAVELVNGLRGDYYDGASFITFAFSRIDDNVDFDWGTSGADDRLPTDFFSVRWLGFIEPAVTGTYKFYISADDGQRLWVNGEKISDVWTQGGGTDESSTIELVAGERYPIRLDMFQHRNVAAAKLEWETTDGTVVREVVPKERLFALPLGEGPAPFLTFEAEHKRKPNDPIDAPLLSIATGETASAGDGSAPVTESCDNCSGFARVPLKPAPASGSLTVRFVNVPASGNYLLQIWYAYKGLQNTARYSAPASALLRVNSGPWQEVTFLNNYNDTSVFDSADYIVPLDLGDNEITIAGLTAGAGTVAIDRITVQLPAIE